MVSLSDWYEPGTFTVYTRSPVYSGNGVLSCAAAGPAEPAKSASSVKSIRTRTRPLGSAIMIRAFPPDKFAVKTYGRQRLFGADSVRQAGSNFASTDDIENQVALPSGARGREILYFFDIATGRRIESRTARKIRGREDKGSGGAKIRGRESFSSTER